LLFEHFDLALPQQITFAEGFDRFGGKPGNGLWIAWVNVPHFW
jgi:hypothetical protein